MIGTIFLSGRVVKPFGPVKVRKQDPWGEEGAIMIYQEQEWRILAAAQENTETEFVSYEMDVHDEVSAKGAVSREREVPMMGGLPLEKKGNFHLWVVQSELYWHI